MKTAAGSSSRFIDPKALLAIRNLELRAKVVVEGFCLGLHRSPYHGFSVEFSEYRQYTPGDDPRYLDWKLFARSDRYYLKKFEDETNLRCHFLVDLSRSMSFGSPQMAGRTKADYAVTVAASLGLFLSRQGDAVGLLSFDAAVREYLPARNRPGHLHRLMRLLDQEASGKETSLAAPLRRIAEMVRKRGLMILLSDLLSPVEDFAAPLAELRAFGHEVVVLQVLDPAELDFDFEASAQFEDLETGVVRYVDPARARSEYQTALGEHLNRIRKHCLDHGITWRLLRTDRPVEEALHQFLAERR